MRFTYGRIGRGRRNGEGARRARTQSMSRGTRARRPPPLTGLGEESDFGRRGGVGSRPRPNRVTPARAAPSGSRRSRAAPESGDVVKGLLGQLPEAFLSGCPPHPFAAVRNRRQVGRVRGFLQVLQSRLGQAQRAVGASPDDVSVLVVLAVVLPAAFQADLEVGALLQSAVAAAWTLDEGPVIRRWWDQLTVHHTLSFH